MPFRGAFGEFTRNQELTLDLPAKPFVRLRIACDRVQEDVVRQLVEEIRDRRHQSTINRVPQAPAEPHRASAAGQCARPESVSSTMLSLSQARPRLCWT